MTAAAATTQKKTPAGLSNKARDMMEAINAEAAKHQVWVRTQANAPAQRAWFSETSGEGTGQLASGRVAANQMKTLPYLWRWSEFSPYLHRISEIARKADVSPIEFADRQSILLLNPGLNGRLQVTNTIRCAISIYNPGDVAPVHLHSPNASRTILSDKGGYTVVEGERCDAARGDLILTPNGTWHDHGNDSDEPVIWIDMLDWPLMEFLDCAWVDQEFQPAEGGNARSQITAHRDGYCLRRSPDRRRPQPRTAHSLPRRRRARHVARATQRRRRSARGHQSGFCQPGHGRAGVQDLELFGATASPGREDRAQA
ncbi:MAG: cupin domain-containing protein [Alphaproteobacteria bacterium]|nr:MAG: cupin domain-containing protein [Alphaproteobacteria bacterium]